MFKFVFILFIHSQINFLSKTKSFNDMATIKSIILEEIKFLHFRFEHNIRGFQIRFHLLISFNTLLNILDTIADKNVIEKEEIKDIMIFYEEKHTFNLFIHNYIKKENKNDLNIEQALSIAKESIRPTIKHVITYLVQNSMSLFGGLFRGLEVGKNTGDRKLEGSLITNSNGHNINQLSFSGVYLSPKVLFRMTEYKGGVLMFTVENDKILTFENQFSAHLTHTELELLYEHVYDVINLHLTYSEVLKLFSIFGFFTSQPNFVKVISRTVNDIFTLLKDNSTLLGDDILKEPIKPKLQNKIDILIDIYDFIVNIQILFNHFLSIEQNLKIEVFIDINLWTNLLKNNQPNNLPVYYDFRLDNYIKISKFNKEFMLNKRSSFDYLPDGNISRAQYFADKSLEIINLLNKVLG